MLRYVTFLGTAVALLNVNVALGAYGDASSPKVYESWMPPGVTVSSPTGYGAGYGAVYAGGGMVNRNRRGNDMDGGLGFGFGLGNANKTVGLETSVGISDVSGFSRGGLNLKLHRSLGKNWGVAVAAENIAKWGDSNNALETYYIAFSKSIYFKPETEWFSSMTISAGVGDGRFRSIDNENAGLNGFNFFSSLAFRVRQPVAVVADWTGQDLNMGLSITPFRKAPIFLNVAALDLVGNAGDGIRFSSSLGLAYMFGT